MPLIEPVPLVGVAELGDVHFIAIGGAGMSGVAAMFAASGVRVSGSDQADSATLAALADLGIRTSVGHDPAHLGTASTVVVSSAVRETNPELADARRRGLRAMTLEVPGTDDVLIARSIAQRYGLDHEVHGLSSIRDIDPADAWSRCIDDAVRLDAMSDPIALASQRVAEQAFDQGVRISGLGGEIARGFYYLGRVRDRAYTRTDAERLASWRMFVNEAVESDLLDADFTTWARDEATTEVHRALIAGGDEWFRASDDLYVRHRMQRWAGATDTAVSDRRVVVNPMLDPGFLDIVRRLAPQDKAGSRFLARLQMELDPELGLRPLDRRPAPAVYASPPRWQPALDAASLARRAARKGLQKVRRGSRPPAGGTEMTHKVVEFWRAHPETLDPFVELDFVNDSWVEDVLAGRVDPRPSSVAFVTNLVVAASFGQPTPA